MIIRIVYSCSVSFCYIYLKPVLCFNITPCLKTHVVCHVGTMKSEEFLLSQTLASCSNHPSSPEQPRSGNPGRSVVLSTNTRPPSSYPFSSPLLLSYLPPLFLLCYTTVFHAHFHLCYAMIFCFFHILLIFPSLMVHCCVRLLSQFMLFFIHCFPTSIPSK